MELTFPQQTTAFFLSIVLGIFLAVFYGLLKFLRFSFSLGKVSVMALDIFFMLVWAMSVFFFSLGYLMGYIRVYVFLGSLLGFVLYRMTLGRLLFHIYRPVIRFFRVIFHKICIKSKIIAKYLLKFACKLLYNISSKKDSFRKKRNCKIQSDSTKRKFHEFEKTKNKKGRGKSRGNRRRKN